MYYKYLIHKKLLFIFSETKKNRIRITAFKLDYL